MKIKRKLFCFLMLLIIFTFNDRVYAAVNDTKLVTKDIDGVFAVQKYKNGSGSRLYYAQMYEMHKGNQVYVGYCIELGAKLNSSVYSSTDDYSKVNISSDIAEYIRLVSYYGYKYSNHNSYKYYLAAQELMWEKMTGDEVYWTTEESASGNRINVELEKREIASLVSKHNISPSFDIDTINYGEKAILKDKNGVLGYYEIVSAKGANLSTIGGNYHITPTTLDNIVLTIKRRITYTNKEVFYYAPNSQKIVSVGFIDEKEATYEFKNNGVRIKINKKDRDTDENIQKEGIAFKLYDVKNKKYICVDSKCQYQTNKDGVAYLPYVKDGKYKIEEVDMKIDGYLYNSSVLEVEVNRDKVVSDNVYGKVIEVDFYNKKPTGTITVNKKGEKLVFNNNKFWYEEIDLEGVEFAVIANENLVYNGKEYKKGEIIKTLITDENGEAVINYLQLGEYIIKEIKSLANYALDTKEYVIKLEYVDQYTEVVNKKLEVKNELQKGSIHFRKIDSITKKGLGGVLIGLYDSDDKKICEVKTDYNGNIFIDNLAYGSYYFKELKAVDGYSLDESKISFVLDDSNKEAEIVFKNSKIEMPPKTSGNDYLRLFSMILLIIVFLVIRNFKKCGII